MKLYFTPTSPYVRKVLVAARELGLADRIETILLRPTPTKVDPELSRVNPLSKIPALVLDDGTALFDSAVICEYLDELATSGAESDARRARLVPPSGAARFRVLRRQALADGALEAAVLVFYERSQRPEALHWMPWIEGQTQKALQGLDALDREARDFDETGVPDLGQIAAAVTLGWLEFRGVIPNVREGRPALAAWYERFASRPSMRATAPAA
jgi:glutathione S-transferase